MPSNPRRPGPKRKKAWTPGQAVHRHLLEAPKVRSWYDRRSLRSTLSADSDLRKLGLLCERVNLGPMAIVDLAQRDPDRLGNTLVRYSTELVNAGRTEIYILKTLSGLRNWLQFNRSKFDDFPKLRAVRGTSIANERVPSPSELRQVLNGLSTRGRVIALLMAHTGSRPGALASYRATDGLRLRNLPELDLEALRFSKVPFVVEVPAALSKTSKAYISFGTSELGDALVAYLKERRDQGEKLVLDSPLISVASQARALVRREASGLGGFVTTKALVFELRSALKRNAPKGVRWRPYCLRAYFSTQMWTAENHARITRIQREAMMGHDLRIDGGYNLSKPLGTAIVEEMRVAYARSVEFLESGDRANRSIGQEKLLCLLLKATGVPTEAVADRELSTLTD